MSELIAVMPAYNERENIADVIYAWLPVIREHNGKLVVVDDGSTDNTADIVEDIMKKEEGLYLLKKENGGHGSAVLAGYGYACDRGATWIFQTDSDGQTNPAEFERFWRVKDNYDAVFGMRRHRKDGFGRELVEMVLSAILRLVFNTKVPDANAPYRLMRAQYVREYIDKLPSDYDIPNVMLTMYFVRYGKRVRFCEISFDAREKGKNTINIKSIMLIGIKSIFRFIKLRETI